MSTSVAIVGPSGAGKSRGIKTLDPATTFIINADKKSLPWQGWRNQYVPDKDNYLVTSEEERCMAALKGISSMDKFRHIKTIIVDTVNGIMVDEVMEKAAIKGYDKWTDLAQVVYNLVSIGNSLRDDLIVMYLFHSERPNENEPARIQTSGRMLSKICLETKFPIVLFARPRISKEGRVEYGLETRWNNSTAKSPEGMFADAFIPNDYAKVCEAIRAYEQ